jgi:hypothetical protein
MARLSPYDQTDIFGYEPWRHKKPVDIFNHESDLSDAERFIVAEQLVTNAEERYPFWSMRRDKEVGRVKDEAARYCNCGKEHDTWRCPDDDNVFWRPYFCHCRICERCARIHANRLKRQILPIIKEIDGNRRRGYFLALTTLTVTTKRFGDDLPGRDGIAQLYRESTQLLRQYFNKFAMVQTRTGKWREDRKRFIGAGWVATVECGKDNNNLHIHALTYGPYRSQAKVREAWEAITGDSYRVNIKPKSPRDVVNYILKYIAKPPQTDSYARLAAYLESIRGSRRLRTGGIFYNRFKRIKVERKHPACPFCGSSLRWTGRQLGIECEGYNLRDTEQHPEKYQFTDDDREILRILPRDVTPLCLPKWQ